MKPTIQSRFACEPRNVVMRIGQCVAHQVRLADVPDPASPCTGCVFAARVAASVGVSFARPAEVAS